MAGAHSFSALRSAMRLDSVQQWHREQVIDKMNDGRYPVEEAVDCLCGSPDYEVIRKSDRFGIPVRMVICPECGLLRTTPRLASTALPAFYEEDYHGLHMGAPRPVGALYLEGQGALIFNKVMPHLPSDRNELLVYEIGCGAGSVLAELRDEAKRQGIDTRLVGCDYSAAYVAEGKRLGIDLRHGGSETLRGPQKPDLIILSHVVEHFVDMKGELESIASLCDSNTLVYIEVPGVLSIDRNADYSYRLDRYFTLAHIFHFTSTTLVATLRRAAFTCLGADEHVSAVFRYAKTASANEPNAYPSTLRYLRDLESPSRRARSLAHQAKQDGRRYLSTLVRRLTGEAGVTRAKQLEARLRLASRLIHR